LIVLMHSHLQALNGCDSECYISLLKTPLFNTST
jgi:hypothetical protein